MIACIILCSAQCPEMSKTFDVIARFELLSLPLEVILGLSTCGDAFTVMGYMEVCVDISNKAAVPINIDFFMLSS
ncbi:protein of unknown function [Paenibacillus alvei]|uniref:Uncharacterized protein n=1 Tax=Paenibacillus alvei TaxID=44250 RepID=A0A383RER7_PAEAL|nr:protein of unknown function [Paenibacillus alvei]